MVGEAERVTRFLRDEVGETLRAVVAYDDDSCEVVYVRDDLKQDEGWQDVAREDIDRIVAAARNEDGVRSIRAFGDYRATVRLFEHAVVLQFPTATGGFGVSLEPEVSTRLSGFAARIRSVVGE